MKRNKVLSLIISVIFVGLPIINMGFVSAMGRPYLASAALQSDACGGLTELDPSQNCSASGSQVGTTLGDVVNILSYFVGVVAIIMILVSGFRYVTSGGEPEKVSGAKRGLTYALIGLVVAALAQLMVHYVLYKIS
jgi:hypothetical protein